MTYPLMSSQPATLFEPQWPAPPIVPNLRNTLEAAKLTNATGIYATPSFLEVSLNTIIPIHTKYDQRHGPKTMKRSGI